MQVYIADDNSEFVEFCVKVAKQEGWTPVLCEDGVELLRDLRLGDEPALVLCDLNMPNFAEAHFLRHPHSYRGIDAHAHNGVGHPKVLEQCSHPKPLRRCAHDAIDLQLSGALGHNGLRFGLRANQTASEYDRAA